MSQNDITKPVDLLTHAEGTGPLRFRRPVYMDFMPPCNSACPAGENIQAWLAHAQAGNYFEAFQTILEDNPFPAIMGRVCVKPCETGCNRNHIESTVNIHAVERFIGDEAIRQKWPVQFMYEETKKRILVIGAGPGGLSAAYHLARMGHTVEVYDAGKHPGGLLWTGVPEYRLPKEILDAEVERIVKMGVKIRLNYKVQDVLTEKQAGNFDAVYISIGAQVIHDEGFKQDGSVYITDAFSFFNEAKQNNSPFVRKKVVVYGGGKLALYLSRVLKRFGSEVAVYFPGDKKMMPAYDYETEDALAEGVEVQLYRSISKIEKKKITLEVLKVEKNKAVGTGELEEVEADVLINANKQEVDSGFLRAISAIKINDDGTVVIDAQRMTGHEGIFAGGDMLPGENRSSTIAIGHGKKAAKYIHGYLMGKPYQKPDKHPTASFRKLHMWYKTDAPQKEQDKLKPEVAVKSFEEVIAGLSEPEARFEAQRCLSCGNCFECDGCFGACPEDAIIKLGKGNRYKFNYNACTGCAVCYEQCPCHAIEMIPEPVNSSTDVK
ncbi:MAG TPA: NAD(P)-binding protein [Chitinophagaceae bacterium]|nr:NAD(P)-binding protein [Chitinophagaceae bacterium]